MRIIASSLLCILSLSLLPLSLKGQDKQPEQTSTDITEVEKTVSFHIFDPHNKLNSEQYNQITKAQRDFLETHQCHVSYGLYDDLQTELSVHNDWKKMVDQETEKSFHLLLRIGAFREDCPISLFYSHPPSLKDAYEIDNVLSSLKRDLGSETGLDNILIRSYESINDELTYLNSKPQFEAEEVTEKNNLEVAQIKEFALHIAKIVGAALGAILALLLLWSILSKIRNRRPYQFPEVNYSTRLGAEYSATSISQIKK